MFGWDDLLQRVKEKPFRPFRLVASEGRSFDIYHPDLVMVGHRDITVGHPGRHTPLVYNAISRIALIHVVALEDLDVPAEPEEEPVGS